MSAKPSKGQVAAAFAAIYLIWGSTYLAIRFGLETLPPFLMAGARFLSAGLALYVWARARGAARPPLLHWRSAALVGAGLMLGGNGLVTWAEQRVPSGVAALLVATVPLWMALLQTALEREFRPPWTLWLGIGLGMAGLTLLMGTGSLAGPSLDRWGLAALMGASLCWAAGSLYSRRASLPKSSILATGMEMIAGGGMLVLLGLALGEARGFQWAAVSFRSGASLAYLILFGSLVGFPCYIWLLKTVNPVSVSSYAYVNPVVAVLLGWAFAGEPFTARMAAAAAAIVTAVMLMTLPRSRPAIPALKEPKGAPLNE